MPSPPTLAHDLATGPEERKGNLNALSNSPEPDSADRPNMGPPSQSQAQRKRKELVLPPRPRPRPLPLFARPDAGHVIFRGNEVMNQQGGLGTCFV